MYYKKMIGKKVYLSVIDKNDYEKYTEWISDMEVALGMIFAHKLIGDDREKATLERLADSGYNFAIIDKESNKVIGNVGMPQIDSINSKATVGIFIGDKDYWGNGYGREALELLLDFGFNILNLNSMNLSVYAYNTQAISCYKKIGFKEAGRLRQAKIIGGNKYDEILMDILACEFKSPYIGKLLEKKIKGEK